MIVPTVTYAAQRIWIWAKTHWKIVAGVAVVVALFFLLRGKKTHIATEVLAMLSQVRKDQEREIKEITATYESEIKAREEAETKYQATLSAIEAKYEKKAEDLTRSEKREIKRILSEDDPESVSQRIADLMGFKVES